uniref:EB domain-containing protein n=1 Tax=Haemonchus placei TaxID=6290 RepID=A0A0N4X539_HAEPC
LSISFNTFRIENKKTQGILRCSSSKVLSVLHLARLRFISVIYPGQVGCRHDLQCAAAHTGASCFNEKCVCLDGSNIVDETCGSGSEPATSPPGGPCTNARKCINGSVCREGWCICPDPTMIVQRGVCIQPGPRPALPTSVCLSCCPCRSVYPFIRPAYVNPLNGNGKGLTKVVDGARCPFDSCAGGATCVDGVCLCPSGTQPSPQGRCEPTAAMTAPSTSSVTCTLLSSPTITHTSRHHPIHHHHLLPPLETDECAAIGLYCRSNTVCRNLSCQCPDGHVLRNDGCVPSRRKKVRGTARRSPTYARPGQKCANGEICVAGSYFQVCTCSNNSILKGDECVPQHFKRTAIPGESCDENTICTQESSCQSGQCRCQHGFIVVSGKCVALPMPTTLAMKKLVKANPLDSCDNGEQCEGGSRFANFLFNFLSFYLRNKTTSPRFSTFASSCRYRPAYPLNDGSIFCLPALLFRLDLIIFPVFPCFREELAYNGVFIRKIMFHKGQPIPPKHPPTI